MTPAQYTAKYGWMKTRVCQTCATNGPLHDTLTTHSALIANAPQYLGAPPSERNSDYWAGNIADENPCNGQSDGIGCTGPYYYSEIDSDWYLPCVAATQANSWPGDGNLASTAWLGLGGSGVANQELVQAGTETDQTSLIGGTNYYAWVEYVGTGGKTSPIQVNVNLTGCGSGDHAYAKINSNNCYTIGSINYGTYYQNCFGPGADHYSAEAIAERVGFISGEGLTDFGTVTFKGLGITESSQGYQRMDYLRHDYLNMWWNSGELAYSKPIVNDPSDSPGDDSPIGWLSDCGNTPACS